MLNAVATETGDAAETVFTLSFGYVDADDVKVEVYESGSWVTKTSGEDYVLDRQTVTFSSPPGATADNIRFSRVTSRAQDYVIPDAAPNSPAVAETIREAASLAARGLYVAQEIEDATSLLLSFDAINWAPGVTSANVKHGQTNTATVGVAVPIACTARTAAVVSYHANDTTPDPWTLRLRKNGAGSDDATFSVTMASSALTEQSSSGDLSAPVEFSAGDRIELLIDGASTVGVIFQITLGFTAV